MNVFLAILAGFALAKWLRAELAGRAVSLMLERRGIHPTEQEIAACAREALAGMIRFWH